MSKHRNVNGIAILVEFSLHTFTVIEATVAYELMVAHSIRPICRRCWSDMALKTPSHLAVVPIETWRVVWLERSAANTKLLWRHVGRTQFSSGAAGAMCNSEAQCRLRCRDR